MAFQITISTAATKTAYQRFGDAFISSLIETIPELDIVQLQTVLTDVISTVGHKAIKEKKVTKTPSPKKSDLKKAELLGELKTYGEFAGDIPNLDDVKISELRTQISTAKKAKRDSTKKSPKTASPSKRQLLKIELCDEIKKLGISLEKDLSEYTITELRKLVKSSSAKKKEKTKEVVLSKRAQKKIELIALLTEKGVSLDKEVAEYKVTELRKMLLDLSPKKKKERKSKKTVTAEADHEALLATLANSLKSVEQNEVTEVSSVQDVAKVQEITSVAEVQEVANVQEVAEVQEVTSVAKIAEVTEVQEVDEDELSSESDLDSSDDDSSDDDSSDEE